MKQLVGSKVGEQEIDPAVVVDVRGRDAETVLIRVDAALLGHVREMIAVVSQDVAARRRRIISRREAPTDEEIQTAITVEVSDPYRALAAQHGRQRTPVLHEPPATLIDVQAVLEQGRFGTESVSATRHVEVQAPIAIRVEEYRGPIFVRLVRLPRLPQR